MTISARSALFHGTCTGCCCCCTLLPFIINERPFYLAVEYLLSGIFSRNCFVFDLHWQHISGWSACPRHKRHIVHEHFHIFTHVFSLKYTMLDTSTVFACSVFVFFFASVQNKCWNDHFCIHFCEFSTSSSFRSFSIDGRWWSMQRM